MSVPSSQRVLIAHCIHVGALIREVLNARTGPDAAPREEHPTEPDARSSAGAAGTPSILARGVRSPHAPPPRGCAAELGPV